jgi:hypothetical protein
MTITNVMGAVLLAFTTITSVAAFAIVLFGSAAALERWLDAPLPHAKPRKPQLSKVDGKVDTPSFDPHAHTNAA